MDTIKINNEQKNIYLKEEQGRMDVYQNLYAGIIEKMKHQKAVAILDIGGGAGFFAKWIKKVCEEIYLKIMVIDYVKYETWDDKDDCIEYVQCDATSIDSILEKESFDYIFCNMFTHHLIGKNFQESATIRNKVFNNIHLLLKPDGKLVIVDNVNDGFLFDESSCRILFAVTTCRNIFIKKVLFMLGAHSAGTGVCMLSLKMWERLLKETGFEIEELRLNRPQPWNIVKKVLLMNRQYMERVLFLVRKSSLDINNM